MRVFKLFTAFFVTIALSLPCIAETTPAAPQSSPIVKRVLDNGLTVIVKPEPGSGLVAIAMFIRAGANQENLRTSGLGNFVAQMLLMGTRMSSAEDVAAVADQVGGNVSAQWNEDFTEIRAVTTKAMFNKAMALMGESLTDSDFEKLWVDQVRQSILRNINIQSDDLFESSYATLRGLLYEDNGYGRPMLGSERCVTNAKSNDLLMFYTQHYMPNNIVISIVGDVTPEQAFDRADGVFAGVGARNLPVDRGVPDEEIDRCKLRASEQDISTAYLLLGWLAPGVNSSDYPAVAVAVNALGGGKGSMMFRELRQKRGMGYDVGATYPRSRYQSHILAYIITDPFKPSFLGAAPNMVLDEVKAALLEQVEILKTAPLSQADLDRAKGYTIGTYALSHQRILDRAEDLGWLEAAGVGYQSYTNFPSTIEKVTAEDVQRVAKKYFTNYAAVLLLPKTQSPESGAGKN